MEREEEMWKYVEQEHGELSRREALVCLTTMEWADKTIIDKACEWLLDNMSNYVRGNTSYYAVSDEKMVKAFRKAMEEEV